MATDKFQDFFGDGDRSRVPIFQPKNAKAHTNYQIYDRWPDGEDEYLTQIAQLDEKDGQFENWMRRERDLPKAAARVVQAIRDLPGFARLGECQGDILIFMPTIRRVDDTVDAVKALNLPDDCQVMPCHAQWTDDAAKAFKRSEHEVAEAIKEKRKPRGQRIIVATTYAETSVTITNLRYVIDSGYVNTPDWDAATRSRKYDSQPHSQAGCTQRKGRVGRTQEGECFRLYTQETYETKFLEQTPPQVTRTNLDKFLLKAKACGIDDLTTYAWLGRDETSPSEIERACAVLRDRGAIDSDNDITPDGVKLDAIEASTVELSQFMADSDSHACTLETATLLAFVSSRGRLFDQSEEGLLGFQRWRLGCFDDLDFYFRIFHQWEQQRDSAARKEWCLRSGIKHDSLDEIQETRERSLKPFTKKTHTPLTDRLLDLRRLHRTRLVIARSIPESLYTRGVGDPVNRFGDTFGETPVQWLEINDESACVARPEIEAIIAIERVTRRGVVKAQHVIRIDPAWIPQLRIAGPIARALLFKQVVEHTEATLAAATHDTITTAAPPIVSISQRGARGNAIQSFRAVREIRGPDGPITLLVRESDGAPVLLRRPDRSIDITPGASVRATIDAAHSPTDRPYASQERLLAEYKQRGMRSIDASVRDIVFNSKSNQPDGIRIEMEPGIGGILWRHKMECAALGLLNSAPSGEMIRVVIGTEVDSAKSSKRTTGELLFKTEAFARGEQTPPDPDAPYGALIRDVELRDDLPVTLWIELSPGQVRPLSIEDLPSSWHRRKWKPGQPLRVIQDKRGKRCFPVEYLEDRARKFPVGTRVTSRVVRPDDRGAEVQFASGYRGFVPASELARESVSHAAEIVAAGQELDVEVFRIAEQGRVFLLSHTRTLPDPWATAAEEFPPETVVEGIVTGIQSYGAFVEISPGITGLLPIGKISDAYIENIDDVLAVGQGVRCVILKLDSEAKRIELSMRGDPSLGPLKVPPRRRRAVGLAPAEDRLHSLFDALEQKRRPDKGQFVIRNATGAESKYETPEDRLRQLFDGGEHTERHSAIDKPEHGTPEDRLRQVFDDLEHA